MKRMKQSLAAIVLFTIVPAAVAHPPGGLARLDSDGDGVVSRAEFEFQGRHGPPRLFGRADADGDGQITREEVQEAIAQDANARREHLSTRMLALFDEVDGDGNGVVTREELTAHAFARLDADGDGYVSEDEARALRDRHPPRHKRPPGPAGSSPAAAVNA